MTSPLFRRHRLPREAFRGAGMVLVTIVTRQRGRILDCPEVAGPLVEALRGCLIHNTCRSPAYCFMPDHLHVLIQGIAESSDAWQAVVEFKQITAAGTCGAEPVAWQRGFDTRLLLTGVATEAAAAYVSNNPVRAGLVEAWQDWAYSGSIWDDGPVAMR